MNKRISFIVSVVMAAVIILSAAGCAVPERSAEHLEDYVFTVRYHDNFNILQLTDIHWNVNTSAKASYIVAKMQLACRSVAGEYDFSHCLSLLLFNFLT